MNAFKAFVITGVVFTIVLLAPIVGAVDQPQKGGEFGSAFGALVQAFLALVGAGFAAPF